MGYKNILLLNDYNFNATTVFARIYMYEFRGVAQLSFWL